MSFCLNKYIICIGSERAMAKCKESCTMALGHKQGHRNAYASSDHI